MPAFENPHDFEKVIKLLFEQDGWRVIVPPANTRGYDLEVIKGEQVAAVQVKNYKAKVNVGRVEAFASFLDQPSSHRFNQGFFVAANGFSQPAITHVLTDPTLRIALGTYTHRGITWEGQEQENKLRKVEERRKVTYIGVFTCKGGVGKTTVAAHLGGAFALMGYEVVLVDLDPEGNLKKLLVDDVYIPGPRGAEGAVVSVVDREEWDEKCYPEVKIVICDCSPSFERNPKQFLQKFDYCIIPTTLNPLGVNKHGNVIIRTFKDIREVNDHAELFALINNYYSDEGKKNQVLSGILKQEIKKYSDTDPKCKYIDPKYAAIRFSKQLLNWGYHIVENRRSELAFREIGGRNYPRIDFLNLVDYLEDHTNIESLKDN